MPKFKPEELFLDDAEVVTTPTKKKKKKKKAATPTPGDKARSLTPGDKARTPTPGDKSVSPSVKAVSPVPEEKSEDVTYERYRQGLREDLGELSTPTVKGKRGSVAPLRLPALGSSVVGLPVLAGEVVEAEAASVPAEKEAYTCTREIYENVVEIYSKVAKHSMSVRGVSGHELLFSLRNSGFKREARHFIESKSDPSERVGWEEVMVLVLKVEEEDVPGVMKAWGYPKGWVPSFNPVHWVATQSEGTVRDVLMLWCLMTERRARGRKKSCGYFEGVPLRTVEEKIQAVEEAQRGRPVVDYPFFRTFGETFWPDCKDSFSDLFQALDTTNKGFLTPGSLVPLIVSSTNPLTTVTTNIPDSERKQIAAASTYTNRYLHFSKRWMWDTTNPPPHLSPLCQ